ncbi:DUF1616 domain-containing protein [Chloroflexota bacterium]
MNDVQGYIISWIKVDSEEPQVMEELSSVRAVSGVALPLLDGASAVRVSLGFILVFLLPGFAWTLVFFSGREINILERLALSLGLSIAVVTLSILAINLLLGGRITGLNSVMIILVITIVPIVFYSIKRLLKRSGNNV